MWAFLWLFLWAGLIIILITMAVVGRWMWKRWDLYQPTTDEIVAEENRRQAMFEEWLINQEKEEELTRELNEEETYPYTHDKEGNVILKNP